MMPLDGVLSGHLAETSARRAAHEVVLVAQDTTEIDYGAHRCSEAGLGPMGKQGSWGVLAHSALAMTESGLDLGTLSLLFRTRDPEESARKRERRSKGATERESEVA
jgi:hypothetical protein